MPLATKNNALIVKDGKVAENCNCCAGWYCYCENDCNTTPACAYCLGSCPPYRAPESFTATITASDYVNRVMGRIYYNITGSAGAGVGLISYFKGSAIAGTHTLTRNSATVYSATLPDDPDCSQSPMGRSSISFNLSSCTLSLSIRRMHESSLANYPYDTPPKEKSDLDCTQQSCPTAFSCATANSSWILRNGSGINGSAVQTASKSFLCSEINGAAPIALSMTLPEAWWIEGSFVGFGFTSVAGTGGPYGYVADPVVYEKSGSRDITATVSPNY
jgi:hypothetical protein